MTDSETLANLDAQHSKLWERYKKLKYAKHDKHTPQQRDVLGEINAVEAKRQVLQLQVGKRKFETLVGLSPRTAPAQIIKTEECFVTVRISRIALGPLLRAFEAGLSEDQHAIIAARSNAHAEAYVAMGVLGSVSQE